MKYLYNINDSNNRLDSMRIAIFIEICLLLLDFLRENFSSITYGNYYGIQNDNWIKNNILKLKTI